jgi:hypothetical protein
LLDKKINESVGQRSFRDKCEGIETGTFLGYRNTPFAITRDLDSEIEWTSDLIKSRSRWIRDCLMNIWTVNPELESVVPFHDWKDPGADTELF